MPMNLIIEKPLILFSRLQGDTRIDVGYEYYQSYITQIQMSSIIECEYYQLFII